MSGKRFKNVSQKVDSQKKYTVDETFKLAVETAQAK